MNNKNITIATTATITMATKAIDEYNNIVNIFYMIYLQIYSP